MSAISIIMTTYNKADLINLTLSGFLMQTTSDFELIVINDGSTDNTEDVVKGYSDKLRINYYYQENKGRSEARNIALNMASGKSIIFCDDDRIPDTNFVDSHYSVLKNNPHSVTIGWNKVRHKI